MVGIIHQGVLVNEGRLDELISVENRTEIILENASENLLDQIRSLVDVTHQAEVVSEGNARTTLEDLFLRETMSDAKRKAVSK